MTETKQDVFNGLLKTYIDENKAATDEWGGEPDDPEEWLDEWNAATDETPEQAKCLYCHVIGGAQKVIICAKRFDGDADNYLDVVMIDKEKATLSMEFTADMYNPNEDTLETDDVIHTESIKFCPMCGRKLSDDDE